MVRYTEIEKERSRRRQKVLMGGGGMWGGTLKLQMVNAGVIPIKKGTKLRKKKGRKEGREKESAFLSQEFPDASEGRPL